MGVITNICTLGSFMHTERGNSPGMVGGVSEELPSSIVASSPVAAGDRRRSQDSPHTHTHTHTMYN